MQDKALLYFMDPLCGWCYGFSDVINTFRRQHPELRYELITGGMVVGDREGHVKPEFADYILQALPRLEEYTGAEIGESFRQGLRDRSMFMSSIRPTLAMHVVKHLLPGKEFDFTSDLQKRHYVLGEDLQQDSTYEALAEAYGLDPKAFMTEMNSEANRYRMQQDFSFTANCNIQGFPAVVIKTGEQYFLAARGYTPLQQLEETFAAIMQEV